MSDVDTAPPARRHQVAIIAAIFTLVLAVLVGGYVLLLHSRYAVLAEGVRPPEAAAIVADLDKRGIAYKLRDGGTTILVPENEADATRLAVAGSNAVATGQVGFELFNKSDMGLTNFAQKINYQRALQGELIRTITMMDGVESARVHLALPERALFRDDRTEPTAAVTVAMKPGELADPARVGGIQRLVAAAVTDLPADKVVVLDAEGRVISGTSTADASAEPDRPADLEERSAVEHYYRARARAAVEAQMPGLRFQLRATALPLDGAQAPDAVDWTPSGDGSKRNFRLRLLLITQLRLNPEEQTALRNAVTPAAALDLAHGDEMLFEVGPVDAPAAADAQQSVAAVRASASDGEAITPATSEGRPAWLWIVAAVALLGLLAWRFRPAGGLRLTPEEHDAFAQSLRRQLAIADGGDDATR